MTRHTMIWSLVITFVITFISSALELKAEAIDPDRLASRFPNIRIQCRTSESEHQNPSSSPSPSSSSSSNTMDEPNEMIYFVPSSSSSSSPNEPYRQVEPFYHYSEKKENGERIKTIEIGDPSDVQTLNLLRHYAKERNVDGEMLVNREDVPKIRLQTIVNIIGPHDKDLKQKLELSEAGELTPKTERKLFKKLPDTDLVAHMRNAVWKFVDERKDSQT